MTTKTETVETKKAPAETPEAPEAAPRTKSRTAKGGRKAATPSKTPSPVAEDSDNWGPTAYAAEPVGEITHDASTQEFVINEERRTVLHFAPPGQPLGKAGLFCIKAFTPSGILVQLPLEGQVNNQTAAPESLVGLRKYSDRGYTALFDYETNLPVYCSALDCWAEARPKDAFCSDAHGDHTLRYKSRVENVTTSEVWNG